MQPTLIKEILDSEGNVIEPFEPELKWDLTQDKVIQEYAEATVRGCEPIEGQKKSVEPWVIETVQTGMRKAVTDGTLKDQFEGATISAAGKTGTAEYCDQYAAAKNLCIPGNWPSHAWTVGYAPYENPEIAVVAFVYSGGEGASVAGPMVRRMLETYMELYSIDSGTQAQ